MTDLSASDAAGLPARRAALDLLAAALNRRSGFDEAAATPAFRNLEPRDRGFARALVLATLRHLGPIDRALDGRISREPPEVVRNILRLGAAQAFVLGTPAFAAVGTSVDLVAELKEGRAFKGVVNAILRGLTREPPDMTDPELLAPPWLFSRWSAAFGEPAARAMATLIAAEPATDLSLKAPSPDLAASLEAEELPGGTLRSALRGEISTWPGFADGVWWVQDASAAVPARLLGAKAGETVLDLCAAPGGKTLQLAATGASVVALDRSASRLVRVAENLARMGLTAETATDDAGSWPDTRTFDAVLLDAPCSATGTYRRNPDVLWAAKPGDVAALAGVQSRLLDSAARRVKPGGRLVYCVCSLEPEEGESQTAGFLARNPDFALAPMTAGEGGAPEASLRPDGTLRILPHHLVGGTDGFFVARYTREA
ncbi:MAG: RsmB/NOP family class I SAM-dependent RNA methyltransferase [Phenylobacterium sp.]|uniref:RsmB/NOP family class I SAM-dependent RNA methyltransferase n=1 Tax=Phenylobacterium sp. TaxID=1871053 RepID=UPI00271A599B|nr:RsmB/NOP family class I SAM-dependent RNA methyltransferase [Phenylobacterium sp.]MDO8913302.1 RsmB/NOP family class I SAM-dependent RNA methyltransferase [Phenylobacterium sp.]MDP3102538.1 RsmB/NOP family class I SAM-dependent RNA methyltransferase [Phenylobacterium sp.]